MFLTFSDDISDFTFNFSGSCVRPPHFSGVSTVCDDGYQRAEVLRYNGSERRERSSLDSRGHRHDNSHGPHSTCNSPMSTPTEPTSLCALHGADTEQSCLERRRRSTGNHRDGHDSTSSGHDHATLYGNPHRQTSNAGAERAEGRLAGSSDFHLLYHSLVKDGTLPPGFEEASCALEVPANLAGDWQNRKVPLVPNVQRLGPRTVPAVQSQIPTRTLRGTNTRREAEETERTKWIEIFAAVLTRSDPQGCIAGFSTQ